MQRIEQIIEKYITENQMKKRFSKILLLFSLIISTSVFFMLKLNGIALVEDPHIHTEECYEEKLICNDESEEHVHDETCYEKVLICDKEEVFETIQIQADVYKDQTFTELADDSTQILVSGQMPSNIKIQAYPEYVEVEGYQSIGSYHIEAFNEDGTSYQLEHSISVELKLSENIGNDAYVYDALKGSIVLDTQINENSVSFETNTLSTFAILKAIEVENAMPIGDGGVSSEDELRSACANGTEKTIQLDNDFVVTQTIQINGNITLDLNGHQLTVEAANLFNVPANSSVTIQDSSTVNDESIKINNGQLYGNNSTFENDVLTYYVTESEITDAGIGTSQETLYKHTVNAAGKIVGNVAKINGGEVNLNSGMIVNGTNRAFELNSGTLNLNGGYIAGFKKVGAVDNNDGNFGGAILANNGIIHLTGSVLAGNEALNGGAIYMKGSTTLNMTGGIISGNTSTRSTNNWNNHSEGALYRCGGGGIYMEGNTTFNMEDGYITNNKAVDEGYFDGGGGILFGGESMVTIHGGYLTGNEAAGGGAVRSDWNKNTKFEMNGGNVSSNYARSAEGGGIAITQGGKGNIYAGYINNNITNTNVHWGGGGVFCSDGSYLYIQEVLVSKNHAGGFGGGVAGCSTGRVYLSLKKGGAIWENTADGEHMSGNGSTKNEDHTYGSNSPVFMENGYQDFFGALNSVVYGQMLGGGSSNWSGSKDGVAVHDVPADSILEAAYVMGLTADPSGEDVSKAKTEAKLYVTGNSSYTHGGGILCNGYLLIGDVNPISVGSRFTLSGTKKLLQNGRDVPLDNYSFKFEVTNENNEIVSIGTSDSKGNINFDRLISLSDEICKTKIHKNGESATFIYYLKESSKQDHLDVDIDSTIYKISVSVTREDKTLPLVDEANNPIIRIYYKITSVKVEKSTDQGNSWSNVSNSWKPSSDEQHAGSLTITNNSPTFTNQKGNTTSLTVNKKWVGTETLPDSITVDLLKNGVVVDTVVLTKENGWTYTWNALLDGYEYTIYEHPISGYDVEYIYSNTQNKKIWIPASSIEAGKKYLLVTNDSKVLLGNPNNNGAYDIIYTNFNLISILNGKIDNQVINENMQWVAVTLTSKEGLYLKNVPSVNKHYLSFQNTDTVKVGSNDTTYASKATIENGYLKLTKNDDANKVKYVVKQGDTLKASDSNTNAVRLFVLQDEENTITIVNTKVADLYDLEILKVSESDHDKYLSGAVFNLMKENQILKFTFENGVYTYNENGTMTNLETDENGRIILKGIPKGEYTLREIIAPSGYELTDDKTVILGEKQDETKITIQVEDKEIIYELPETGGFGKEIYLMIGLVLMGFALINLYNSKHKLQ